VKPLGIFDSGVGGLTVAKAIHNVLPHTDILYVGDTEHMPYGDKSPETIRGYAKKITSYLVGQNIEALVIACNTASAHAYPFLRASFPDLPIINMVDPVINYIKKNYSGKAISIIATRGTIQSGVYPARIRDCCPETRVFTLATPLLAPLVEENLGNSIVIRGILEHYLDKPPIHESNLLVLACTHYPLLINEIENYLGQSVHVIDPGLLVAEAVSELFPGNPNAQPGELTCLVTDYTESFEQIARRIFSPDLRLSNIKLPE
jgi:glutamate racemase